MKKLSYKEVMGFDDKWLMIIGVPIISLVVFFLLFGDQFDPNNLTAIPACSIASLMYTFIFWITFRWLICQFVQKYPEPEQNGKRILYQTIALLMVYVVIKFILHQFIDPITQTASGFDQPSLFKEISVSLTVIFLIIAIYEAIRFYSLMQIAQTEKAMLARENLQSQLDGLKNQVNPHFLFNSLNTLSHLIPEDEVRAEAFVQKMASVYRYILQMRDEPLITLSEELDFLNAYIYLLKERFSTNFNVHINVSDEHLEKSIIPLSLQILIENAIKHNTISNAEPLHIQVGINKANQLFVENNLQPKNDVSVSTKIGLQNIKNRYALLTDQTVEIIQTTKSFVVCLPLLIVGASRN